MTDFLPRRVASLQPSATSTLHRLGLMDRVVTCTRHCQAVVPEIENAKVKRINDSWTAKKDEILTARPDFVIASVPYQTEAIAQILATGVRVLALAPRTLADVYGDIATIANVMGVGERGQDLVNEMRQRVESVRERTAGCERLRVYCEEWGKPLMVSQPWVAELADTAGGDFVGTPATVMSLERIEAQNPEVIVFAWCGAGDRVPMETLIAERKWQKVRAVERRAVFAISDEFLTTPGPPLMTGLLALAHAIHPEIFPSEPDFAGRTVMRRLGKVCLAGDKIKRTGT
jgi:iron complex transport system substrate-binding protein